MTEDSLEVRLRELERTITRLEGLVNTGDSLIKQELDTLKSELASLKDELAEKVHVSRYVIVEKIVFGMVGLIVMTVFAAMVSIVVQGGSSGLGGP